MHSPGQADEASALHAQAFSSFLDFARWSAAWVVLFGHARLALFPPYAAIVQPSFPLKAFLFAVMAGRSAVMVFFVLSGYLVGGALVRAPRGRPTLVRYASARFTRLYSVLVPAFALTALLAVIRYFSSEGADHAIFSRPFSLETLALNLANLQGVWNRPYGENFPLWSLTNEFWYYVAFPIGLYSVWNWPRRPVRAAIGVALAIAMLAALSPLIAAYSLVWLLGVGVSLVSWRPNLTISLGACAVSASIARMWFSGGYFPIDLVTGATFASVLLGARRQTFAPRWLIRSAPLNRRLAGFSFSLYAIHFPVVSFVIRYLGPLPVAPNSARAIAIYVGCVTSAIVAAFLFSLITEQRVGVLRSSLTTTLLRWLPISRERGLMET